MKKPAEERAHLISISRLRRERGVEVSVMSFRGAVRETTEDDFRRRLEEAGERSPYLMVVLSDLEYVSPVGLEHLLTQARVQKRRGGWLRIVSPSPEIAMILEVSGAAAELRAAATERDALRDLPSRAA